MKLINTDGMAFIGPGSEWFWTALTAVVVAVTFVAIYRQLSVQAAANATARIESLWAGWATFDMQYYRLVLALHLKYEGIQPGGRSWEKVRPVVGYMGDVARLVKEGHISLAEIAGFSIPFRQWTVALRPFFELTRPQRWPTDERDLEWLAARLEEWDAKHGRSVPLAPTPEWLDDVIERTTANLRLEQDRKAGIIPGPPAEPAAAVS